MKSRCQTWDYVVPWKEYIFFDRTKIQTRISSLISIRPWLVSILNLNFCFFPYKKRTPLISKLLVILSAKLFFKVPFKYFSMPV